jgi:hypothetical protein
LSDQDIVNLCQLYRESESPLMFLVRPSQSTSYRSGGVDTQEPPPLPPPHTRPRDEYAPSLISVDNESSEPGSGYSGGPENRPHHLPLSTIPSHIRRGSTSSVDFPTLARPSIGTPSQPSTILALAPPPAPPSTVASSTDASLMARNAETQRNNGNGQPLSLRAGPSLLSPRTNANTIPPAPPPPTYSPPPPPTLLFHRSSVDPRRPSQPSSTNRSLRTPLDTQENAADRPAPRFIRIDAQGRSIARPGTSVGVHNPQITASFARPGTNTGRNSFLATGRPLSPILRANSTASRPREPWASGSSVNNMRNSRLGHVERPQAPVNTGLTLRTGLSRRISSRSSAVNSPVDGQRSPLNGSTTGPLTSHVTRRREAAARLRPWTPRDELSS